MPEIKEEKRRIDRFNIWIYVGFAILGLLLILIIVGLLFSFMSSNSFNTHVKSSPINVSSSSNNFVKSSSPPIINTNNFKTLSQAPITNDRSKYMSSLFKYGGGFRNRLKKY